MSSNSEQLCYVHCNSCGAILMVNVPCDSLFEVVRVRCGECKNILSVNMATFLPALQSSLQQEADVGGYGLGKDSTSSSTKQLEKKHRTPSLYNCFIKEEIQRLKANSPDMSHKQAFSTAAKNWAHYPQVCGSVLENYKQGKEGRDVLSSKTLQNQ